MAEIIHILNALNNLLKDIIIQMSVASSNIISQGSGSLDSEKTKDIRATNIIAARGRSSHLSHIFNTGYV